MGSYKLYFLDEAGGCIATRTLDADTDFHAVGLAEMLRGPWSAQLFDRSREVAALGVEHLKQGKKNSG
jgi:hypothetical protein